MHYGHDSGSNRPSPSGAILPTATAGVPRASDILVVSVFVDTPFVSCHVNCDMIQSEHLPSSVGLVSNADSSLYRNRAPIMLKLLDSGVRVYAVAPPGRFVSNIEEMGVVFVPWEVSRSSLNPLMELNALLRLMRIYRRLKPDLVQHYTVKPNVYGAVAARLAGVPVVFGGVVGLGSAFAPGGFKRSMLRSVVRAFYALGTALSDRMTFQIEHDAHLLCGKPTRWRRKAIVIPGGSSIDLSAYGQESIPQTEREQIRKDLGILPTELIVTMASRLLYNKGVPEYVEAARAIRAKYQDARFVLAGKRDTGSRDSVTEVDLEAWVDEGSILYIGHRDDMPQLLAISDIVVLPTYYPEGIPRVLIEAAAMSRPIVATTIPGVVEVVDDGVNGLLVTPRDPGALAEAIKRLLDDPALRSRYGTAGREKAEAQYDDNVVAGRYLDEYRKAWSGDRLQ